MGFSILPKDTSTCRQGELNHQPTSNKTLALALSHSRPLFVHSFYLIHFACINVELTCCKYQSSYITKLSTLLQAHDAKTCASLDLPQNICNRASRPPSAIPDLKSSGLVRSPRGQHSSHKPRNVNFTLESSFRSSRRNAEC